MEITKVQFFKHTLIEATGLILVAIGGAGIMKMALGTGPYDALALSISSITDVQVGTIGLFINLLCVLLQMLLLQKKYRWMYLLQIPVSILIGIVLNVFYYQVFSGIDPTVYIARLLLFILFVLLCAFGDALVTASGMIGLALESTCMIFAKKCNIEFGKSRQLADVLFVMLIVMLWYFRHAAFPMREGTVILAICFGPLLGRFTKLLYPKIHRWIYI